MCGPEIAKTMLNGRTALIVEEEFLIALDLQRMLETLGIAQTLFARTPEEAEQLSARWPEIAIAVIEVRLDGAATAQLVESLTAAAIPMVLVAADLDARHGLASTTDMPVIVKPVPDHALANAVRQALAACS
jgi:CheY-like chemotaxis protein